MSGMSEAGWPAGVFWELAEVGVPAGANVETRRRRELELGRSVARRLLESAGAGEACVVSRGERGEPLWPAGFVGSISHSRDELLVCVARRDRFAALGCDVERDTAWEPEALEVAFTPGERAWLAGRTGEATAWFSRKEAAQKCLFGATGRWVDFQRLELRADPDASGAWRLDRAEGADDAAASLRGLAWRRGDRVVSLAWIAA